MALENKTLVTLFNGEVAPLSSVKIGDLLMGEDSKPSKVLSLTQRNEATCEIVPHRDRGQRIVCTLDQNLILKKSDYLSTKPGSMKYTTLPEFLSISLDELLKQGDSFKRSFLLYKSGFDFKTNPVPIDPYFLGAWLGDGHKHVIAITTMDKEIKDEVYRQAEKWGLKVTVQNDPENQASSYFIVRGNVAGFSREKNPFFNEFKKLKLIRNKHIPPIYMQNDRQTRLELLAGLLDTDGYLTKNYYSISQVNEKLTHQICLLANSLGFRAVIRSRNKSIKELNFKGTYHDVSISGKIDTIPVKLPRKQVKEISKKYDRKAIGYSIISGTEKKVISINTENNQNFLLGDGTIIAPDYDGAPTVQERYDQNFKVKWNAKMNEVISFKEKSGRLPQSNSVGKERKMHLWITNNLSRIRKKKEGHLDKIKALLSMGVEFDYDESRFQIQFNHLLAFKKIHPNRWPFAEEQFPVNNKLGVWCRRIRMSYRLRRLTNARLQQFQAIGFPFRMKVFNHEQYLHYLQEFRGMFKRNPYQLEKYPEWNNLGTWFYRNKNKDWMPKLEI